MTGIRTLAIDCGGSGIKGALLDERGELTSARTRVAVEYPMTPQAFLRVLDDIDAESGTFDRATIGMPGMIRHGVVINTPHYITDAGPHTAVNRELAGRWRRFPMQEALVEQWGRPVRVLNDAQVHGAAVITGVGYEVIFTLGTGLGCAIFDEGQVVPKIELSRAPVRKHQIYDTWVGAAARRRIGRAKWERRVLRAIAGLRPMFEWDRLYLGGGEARKITCKLPDDVTRVPNIVGIQGGARIWELSQ